MVVAFPIPDAALDDRLGIARLRRISARRLRRRLADRVPMMKPVTINGDLVGQAADRAGVNRLLVDIGFRGSIVTFVETEGGFALQSLHPCITAIEDRREVGVMGYALSGLEWAPASSLEEGDAA